MFSHLKNIPHAFRDYPFHAVFDNDQIIETSCQIVYLVQCLIDLIDSLSPSQHLFTVHREFFFKIEVRTISENCIHLFYY